MPIKSDYLSDPYLQQLAGLGTSKLGRKRGNQFSATDLYSQQFNIYRQEAEWQHSEDMYNQYQSPEAMVRQYQEAGLNPALMYGQASSPAAVDSSSQSNAELSHSDTGENNGMQIFSAIMSMLQGAAGVGSQIGGTISEAKRRQAQSNIEQQNADTAAYEAETRRMEAEQSIEESKSRISLNSVEELYKQSGIILNEKQVEKMTAEINNFNSQVDMRKAQIILMTIESQVKLGQLQINQSYLDLAWEKWNNGEKAECLAHISLMQQQEMEAYYSGLEKNSLSYLHTQQRHNLVSENRRDEEYHRFIIPHMQAELEEKKRQFKEQLMQQLKISKMQMDQSEINAIVDGLFGVTSAGISAVGSIAGGAIPPANVVTTKSQRNVYHKGVQVGTDSRQTSSYK